MQKQLSKVLQAPYGSLILLHGYGNAKKGSLKSMKNYKLLSDMKYNTVM
jgi:hypothetical protein